MTKSPSFFCAIVLAIIALTLAKSLTGKSCTSDEIAQEGMHKLAIANNDLALNLHRKLSKASQGNVFFSPFSISSALAMLFYGAKGETAEELRTALGYNKANLENEQVHHIFNQFLTQTFSNQNSNAYALKSANAILVDKSVDLIEDYRHEIQRLYEATVQDVEFAKDAPEIVAEVNHWVKDKTNGKIEKLLDKLDRSTALVLLNAVYFKGTWKKQFDAKRTLVQTFYNNGLQSGAKNTEMMHIKEHFPYANIFDCQALELPYKGENISMLILLPNAKDGLTSLEESLTVDKLQAIRKELYKTKVDVAFPKFKIEYDQEMSSYLKSLGAGKIFSPSSDLSGMTSNKVSVNQVLHKAFVEVNEEGSEAAAVTGVVINRMRPMLDDETDFVADHPFVFAIVDKISDMILFLGHVNTLFLAIIALTLAKSLPSKSCTSDEIAQEGMHKLAIANNDLALNLHRKLSKASQLNVFFSPFSISSALAMLFYGAKGETAEELRTALGYNKANLENEQVHHIFNQFLTQTFSNQDSNTYTLKSANAILVDKSVDLIEDYKHEIQRLYEATFQNVEFAKDGPEIVAEVNRWVKDKTNGKIEKLLDKLDPSTVLVLLNAAYFKGTWEKQFDPKRTIAETFYNNGLQSAAKNTEMMHITERFPFTKIFDCEALELPYKGENISMLILLPNANDGLTSLEESLTVDKLQAIRKEMRKIKVDVAFPKFKIEYDREMSSYLKSLGAGKIFSQSANLSGMTSNKVSVNQVLHKAFMEVNEEGSEAAAVTGVLVSRLRPIDFVVDHPFVFAIIDKRSDMILFLGHVKAL
ncbi:uncharacterized protein LOC129226369 [Uloborus diversus]|uniref:uncharacterized protein LOC129226369 n=1 Tax=Uloborus diversus TaxID=327109 RepID=UPI00240A1BB5|nr:uncharacterized protein LOC129226369 [Uloborus diversus]